MNELVPMITKLENDSRIINIHDETLIILNPIYLFEKHGSDATGPGSKFAKHFDSDELCKALIALPFPSSLSCDKFEVKEFDTGAIIGTNSLIPIADTPKWGRLIVEDVRGNLMNIVQTDKNLPETSLLNVVFVRFNSEYEKNIETEFQEKHGKSFDDFNLVYFVLTMFPGKYAPPATNKDFWNEHALLK